MPDCGINGYRHCGADTGALEVWLLPGSGSGSCPNAQGDWTYCAPAERKPLARAIASADGAFTMAVTAGVFRLAVVYRGTLRPLSWQGSGRDETFDHASARTFIDGEQFRFAA